MVRAYPEKQLDLENVDQNSDFWAKLFNQNLDLKKHLGFDGIFVENRNYGQKSK